MNYVSLYVSNSSAKCSSISYIGACDAGCNRRFAVSYRELESSKQHQWHTHQLLYCLEWERHRLCILNKVFQIKKAPIRMQ